MRDLELQSADAESATLRFLAGHQDCEALKEFREGLRLLSNSYPARALIHFMRASEREPSNPYFTSYVGLSVALAHGKWKEGVELCESALRLKRNVPQLHLNLAQVHLSAGNRELAYETLVAGMRFTARDLRLARALERLGVRRAPLFPFLKRSNPLNRYAGRVRHVTGKLLHLGRRRP